MVQVILRILQISKPAVGFLYHFRVPLEVSSTGFHPGSAKDCSFRNNKNQVFISDAKINKILC